MSSRGRAGRGVVWTTGWTESLRTLRNILLVSMKLLTVSKGLGGSGFGMGGQEEGPVGWLVESPPGHLSLICP